MPRPPSASPDDPRLIDLLVTRQIATREELAAYAATREAAREAGRPVPPLGQQLVRDQRLTGAQLARMMAETRGPVSAEPATLPQPEVQLAPLTGTLGRYEIEGELGRGASGIVLLARDTRLGRQVAIKQLRDPEDDRARARLRQEAESAASLEHPGIVRIHEVGDAPDPRTGGTAPYVVMERIDGARLDHAARGLDRALRVELLARIAEAVGHAHGRGVIHRDLKPANVLLAADGRPVVTDFGLARSVDSVSGLTRTGEAVGTPRYMAPEQLRGSRDVGPPADVWALGVMLYELLADRPPFTGQTTGALTDQVLSRELPGLPAGVPRPLAAVCRQALAGDPAGRYPDAGALARDLRRWQAGRAVGARPIRPWSGLARHRRVIAVTLVALGLAVAVVLSWRRSDRRARQARLVTRARAALAAGDLDGALAAARAGAALGDDPALAALGARARRQLDARDRQAAAARRLALARVALQKAMAPHRQAIDAARGYFYIADVDIRAQLTSIDRAVAALERLTTDAAAPRESELWRLLGTGHYHLGRRARARTCLAAALAIDAGDAAARTLLGRMMLEQAMEALMVSRVREATPAHRERMARARTLLASGSARGVSPLTRDVLAAFGALAAGDADAAFARVEAGLQTHRGPGSEDLWFLRGWLQDDARRVEDWTKALEVCPHHAWLRFARGSAYLSLQRFGRARADLDRAIALDPLHAAAFVQRGVARQFAGDVEGALGDFDRALELDPEHGHARLNRAVAYSVLGRHDAALADYARVIQAQPDSPLPRLNRARLLIELRRHDAAGRDIDAVRRRWPDRLEAIQLAATLCEARGDRAGAIRIWGQALARAPDQPAVLRRRAEFLLERGDLNGALADFERALALDPRYYEALIGRGRVHKLSRRTDAALADFGRAIAAAPRRAEAYVNRGGTYLELGQLEPALVDTEKALALDPSQAVAYSNRGSIHLRRGDRVRAEADYSRAIACDRRYGIAVFNRGLVREQLGRHREAEVDYRRAVVLEPALWQAAVRHGMVLARLGRSAEARRVLTAARRRSPPQAHAQIDAWLRRLR